MAYEVEAIYILHDTPVVMVVSMRHGYGFWEFHDDTPSLEEF